MQIKALKLFTRKLQEQTAFYSKTLALPIAHQTPDQITFQIGNSVLTFEYSAGATPYHFAINIPANKIEEALRWAKSRVEILTDGASEIQDFSAWNAKAFYFYDEDRNIVEFIARKNLENATTEMFHAGSLLELSEIGVPTSNVEKVFNRLHQLTGVEIFDGSFERFCAVGNDEGLFICIDKNQKDWFPTGDKAYASNFDIQLQEKGKNYAIEFKNEVIKPANSNS